jgi:uncharacterized protein YbjT (DUF2867 family)
MNNRISTLPVVVVIGATGAMGRPVVRHLLESTARRFRVRALTRDPDSPSARQLLALDPERVELVRGDTSDPASLAEAMRGADGVFCNTDFWSSLSVETEYTQGLHALTAAERAGVGLFVYASLDPCAALSGGRLPVPHYDAKAAVAAHISRRRSDEFMRKVEDGFYSKHVFVLVTGPYYENLQFFFLPERGRLSDGREGYIFRMATGDRPFPMVALDDIAHFACAALVSPEKWGGRDLAVMSESLTIAEVARTFERVTGQPAEHQPLPLDVLRGSSPVGHDLANMHQFVQEFGFQRDYEALRRLHPALLDFAAWLKRTGWRGERQTVQKGPVTGEA